MVPGLFIDNDLGREVGPHFEILDCGDKIDDTFPIIFGDKNVDTPAVSRFGNFPAEFPVNGCSHPGHGRKIGVLKTIGQMVSFRQAEGNLPFNQCPARNAPDGRMVFLNLGGLAAKCKPTDNQGTLGHGIDFSVRTFQGCHQQGAARQAFGVAHGGDQHIDTAAGLEKGGSCAVTMTVAALSTLTLLRSTDSPMRSIILARA